MIKFYYPKHLTDSSERAHLFELIKSRNRLTRKYSYIDSVLQSYIVWVEHPEQADIFILPMSWNYYYLKKKLNAVRSFLEKVSTHNKLVWSVTTGDHGISIPKSNNLIVYRVSGYKSKLQSHERVTPAFFEDPFTQYSDCLVQSGIQNKENSSSVTVGFCGNVPKDYYYIARELWAFAKHRLKRFAGLHAYDVHPTKSTSLLRNRVLEAFENRQEFQTNYIKRNQYRAGAKTELERYKTSCEFYNNIFDSDFIPCVRGAGNFSVRFYETLAMGRIPVFCDTDSPLPEIDGDWDEHIIRFTPKDIPNLPDIIHQWLQGKNLYEVFYRNRKLWEEQLSLQGFWSKELKRLQRDF